MQPFFPTICTLNIDSSFSTPSIIEINVNFGQSTALGLFFLAGLLSSALGQNRLFMNNAAAATGIQTLIHRRQTPRTSILLL